MRFPLMFFLKINSSDICGVLLFVIFSDTQATDYVKLMTCTGLINQSIFFS